MKKIFLFLLLSITNLLFAQKETNDFIFKNANIITLENEVVLRNQSIIIKDGKIVAIQNTKKCKYKAKKIIDFFSKNTDKKFETENALLGGIAYDQTGTPFPQETLNLSKKSDLFSRIGL